VGRRLAAADAGIRLLCLAGLLLAIGGCGGDDDTSRPQPTTKQESIKVTSASFKDGMPIPKAFTCDGSSLSPALSWVNVPAAAQSLALVVADPDAPGGTFYHWLVVDIPVDTPHADQANPPDGGVVEQNSAGETAYMGPCPPSGTHHYRFTLYALSKPTGLSAGASVSTTIDAISTRAIASGTLVGTYSRN
jgi:Raf kinase inhibitor-like YbhB/YbcL family protein